MGNCNQGYPALFTLNAYKINSIIDSGETMTKEELFMRINDKSILSVIDSKCKFSMQFSEQQNSELLDYFKACADDSTEDKCGVNENGYCILIAYLLEVIGNFNDLKWMFKSLSI